MTQKTIYQDVQPLEDFDWDAYEAQDNRNKFNKNIKTVSKKDKVYSHSEDAQEYYDLLTSSLQNLTIPIEGDLVKATINSCGERYAYLDIGWREDAILDLNKEYPEYIDQLVPGAEVEVFVKKTNLETQTHGDLEVSYSEAIKHLKYREIYESIKKPVAFLAKVKELIHGGYFLDINGVRVFMPGSLGGVNKLINFDDLLGKDIYVCAINYSKEKNYIVVSHRAYLQSLIPEAIDSIDPGDAFAGFVTGTTKFGVFVEFNKCLTGLIHKSDLVDDDLANFNSRHLKPGDEVEFTVKETTAQNRIILTQKEFIPVIDPWEDIQDKYTVPSEVTGRIRKKTKYGLFIELEPKIVGLLHVSDIPDYIDLENFQEGDNITLNLVKIEIDSKKVFFKI